MSDVSAQTGKSGTSVGPKKDRSPSSPFIPLGRAVERTRQLFDQVRRNEVRLGDVGLAWGLGAKSSATLQTVAALIAYGLLEDSGSGDARRFKVTDLGWRILEDSRPGVREAALREAALKPKWIAEYAAKWHDGRPQDPFCISELKFDHGFTEDAASKFLRVFDETIQFAGLPIGDTVADRQPATERKSDDSATPKPPAPRVGPRVGDFVQWTCSGVDMFSPPARVNWVSDDGAWLRVDGSSTGIPMTEAHVVGPPSAPATPPVVRQGMSPPPSGSPSAKSLEQPASMRREVFTLDEGDVVLVFPDNLSAASYEDLEAHLQLFLRKAKRRVAAEGTD